MTAIARTYLDYRNAVAAGLGYDAYTTLPSYAQTPVDEAIQDALAFLCTSFAVGIVSHERSYDTTVSWGAVEQKTLSNVTTNPVGDFNPLAGFLYFAFVDGTGETELEYLSPRKFMEHRARSGIGASGTPEVYTYFFQSEPTQPGSLHVRVYPTPTAGSVTFKAAVFPKLTGNTQIPAIPDGLSPAVLDFATAFAANALGSLRMQQRGLDAWKRGLSYMDEYERQWLEEGGLEERARSHGKSRQPWPWR